MTKKAKIAILASAAVVLLVILIAVTPEIIKYVDENRAVAIVNGEKITKKEFSINYRSQIDYYYGLDKAFLSQRVDGKTYEEQIKENVLEGLIIRQIELQQAKKRNITLTAQEKKAIDEQINQYKNDSQNRLQFKQYLQTIGATEDDYKDQLIKLQIVSKLYNEVTKNQTASNSEIEGYYNSHKSDYIQVKASHILFKVSDPKEEAAKKKKAEEVLQMIKNGQSFEKLAQKYSEDETTKQKGGDLGYFRKGESGLDKEFEDATFSLSIGEISPVVKTSYGFHIIKVTDKKQLTLNDVKDEIKSTIESEKKQEYYKNLLEKWKKEAKIKKFENVLKSVSI
ncbi:peptidylprolyl isomerase [Caldicellulosiruptor naganoensis]|uniref:Peptidylprolyl isomerase n=1 Tax=Caldicellulosiruptor naganoensis TaxID=29324 RepID=A0ABY7BJ08_9FIRM|nr:peptidylprolyl isomerase [Caldicellulosiruptor naganoensis]WAM32051.1 peptidylprolyl isomerase [Caldicellulosiruptor naganoensis]